MRQEYRGILFLFGRGVTRIANGLYKGPERLEPGDETKEMLILKNWKDAKNGDTIDESDPRLERVDYRPFVEQDLLVVPCKPKTDCLQRLDAYLDKAPNSIGVGHVGQYRKLNNPPGFCIIPPRALLSSTLDAYGTEQLPDEGIQKMLLKHAANNRLHIKQDVIITVSNPDEHRNYDHDPFICGQEMETGIYLNVAANRGRRAGAIQIASDPQSGPVFRLYNLRRKDGTEEKNYILNDYADPKCIEPTKKALQAAVDALMELS